MRFAPSVRTAIFPVGLVALLLVFALQRPAAATDFGLFAASPGPTPTFPGSIDTEISVSPGEEFTTAIKMILEPGDTISSYAVSVRFDADFVNELDLVAVDEPAMVTDGVGTLLAITTGVLLNQESSGVQTGLVLSFEAVGIAGALVTPGNYTIGTITFKATGNVITDGFDAELGLFNPGVDNIFDGGFSPVTDAGFGTLDVNFVPEPSTAVLVGAGLLALMTIARRGVRS